MENDIYSYDEYISQLFAPQDSALTDTVSILKQKNIPLMQVSANQGKLLQILALMVKAKRIIEIGTLGGYSGIHLARALPDDGKLITFEVFAHHAEMARKNFQNAGLQNKVEVLVGPTCEILKSFSKADNDLFDLIFIDANKNHYLEYLEVSLPLLRKGGVLLADNTLRDALSAEENGIKEYNKVVANHPELTSTIIPILRRFGIDGLTVSFKN
jgi:predicted O-methyltransferase YrrM